MKSEALARQATEQTAPALADARGNAELAHYQDLVEHIPAVLYIDDVSHEYRTTYIGPQLQMLLGISPEHWCDDPNVWSEHIHPDDREEMVTEYAKYLRSGTGTLIQEYRMVRPDNGQIVWIRDDCSLHRDDRGRPSIVQGVMFDITEQRVLQEGLGAAEAKNRALIAQLRTLTSAAARLGASLVPSEVVTTLTEAASELCSSPGEQPRRAVVTLVEGDRVIREARLRNAAVIPMRREGRIFAILAVSGRQDTMMSGDILTHLHTLATMGALAYINAETHQQAALASRTDPLTGVGNRRALDERCAVLPRCPFVLLAIDVDHLKSVNDAHGHEVGDTLLTRVADVMASAIRPSDTLVRTGGDEFVALLVNCDLAGGAEAVARLRAAVGALVFPWGRASVSFGCAAGEPGDSPQSVLAAADDDLYRAKAIRLPVASVP
jgi:diguanylate cyclase (GGDEF)-like protein/PAS domain S-box-containing protein